MSGSEKQQKISPNENLAHPLKGFIMPFVDERTGRVLAIEGMGNGRIRIHAKKGAVAPKKA